MTAIDHTQLHALSVSGLDQDFARRYTAHPDHAELHQLRLALDLQIDSMLLALGAAARDHSNHVPWQRWLIEDLELARVLTAALVESEVEPTPALGGATSGMAHNALDNLVARYSSMEELLHAAVRRPHTGQSWRSAAAHALIRCRTRLEELHLHRAAAHEREAALRQASSESAIDPHHRDVFFPGELLG
jgi:hypothetical protein